MAKMNLAIVDYDDELSSTSVFVPNLSAGNFAAQGALADAFQAAVEAVSIGELRKVSISAIETKIGAGPAADENAQRELKWLVRGVSNTGFPVSFEIPCPDKSLLVVNGGEMDKTTAEWIALKAAAEAYIVSNRLTETVTLVEAVLVGRNI